MTASERFLWAHLRKHRMSGLKWRRQETIGPYIVDFYCAVARVVVEIDGGIHVLKSESDLRRQLWLESEGILVLRFPANAVMNQIDKVLFEIEAACSGSVPSKWIRSDQPEVPHPRFAPLSDPSHGG